MKHIARLNSNGSLDTSFNPGAGFNSAAYALCLQPDEKIVVGGEFTNFNGTNVGRITRLSPDGSIDTSFNSGSGFNHRVRALCLQSDGKIIVGGEFTGYNSVNVGRITRLNPDGSMDSTFICGSGFPNIRVSAIAMQSDGKIIVGGLFFIYNGTSCNCIIRLNTDGSVDSTFYVGPGLNNEVRSIAIQSDGKIIVGGWFDSFNGIPRKRLLRLNSDGTLDNYFNIGSGFNNTGTASENCVQSIALQSDGNIIVGGWFTSFNGIGRNRIVRLIGGDCVSSYNTQIVNSCDSFTWIDGITYTESNDTAIFTFVGGAANGCDSIVTLNLIVNPTYLFEESDTICSGQTLIWRGNNYSLPGTYYDSLLTIHNCDSVYVLNLTVYPTFEFVENEEICDGDIFTWRGIDYTIAGTYYDSLLTVHNCDSVYVLHLTVNPTFEFVENEEICDGEIFTWRGNNFNLPGTYYDSLLTIHNCDSVYVLNLTVNPTFEFVENEQICDGDIFTWRGNSFNLPGTYYDSLLTVYNCDSIYVLNLTVHPTFEFVENEEICDGDIFTWRGNNFTLPGTYYDSLLTVNNCDSVYVLNLTVHPTFEFVQNEEICDGDIFTWRGIDYTIAGTYYDSLLTVNNCDSVYVLNLTVHPTFEFVQNEEICDGDTFTWRGNNYTIAGTYYDSLLTVHNCDSVYVLHLTLNPLPNVSIISLNTFYCDYHPTVTMTGTPVGGTFSGQGVSGNVFEPALAGVGTWAIVYTYTDGNTCTNTDTVIVEVSDCVGIETTQKQILKLYPNPNDGRFIIELHEESNITVINSLGATVHRAFYAAGSHSLDLSYLAGGVYLIKSESKENVNVLRVVISPK